MESKEILVVYMYIEIPVLLYRWIHSEWSQCSKSCGGGHRTRNVSCVQVHQDELKPIQTPGQCDDETKPASQEKCNYYPCHNHWHREDWSRVCNATSCLNIFCFTYLIVFC